MREQARASRRRLRGGGLDGIPLFPLLLLALSLGGGLTFSLRDTGLSSWLLGRDAPAVATYPAQRFTVCAGPNRHTCVIDGDTFWLDGMKVRIADINTPEVGRPECAAEAALGRQATSRLAELLSSGAITLAEIDRDEDHYGRKLRIIERDGRSIGQMLVAEGLAHEWRGRREGWC